MSECQPIEMASRRSFREWLVFSLEQARNNLDASDPKAADILQNILARYDASDPILSLSKTEIARIIDPGAFRDGDVGGLRANGRTQAQWVAGCILDAAREKALSPPPLPAPMKGK